MAAKKQIPLRLSGELYEELARFAQADFRSVNGQIEFLLAECVIAHNKSGRHIPEAIKKETEE